jgi:hypothetical protein
MISNSPHVASIKPLEAIALCDSNRNAAEIATATVKSDKKGWHAKAEWEANDERPYGQLALETIEFFEQTQRLRLTILPSELPVVYRHKFSLNQRFQLWGHQWSINNRGSCVGTARMVLIQGQKNEIINTWVFPKLPSLLPVFAAELIAMGGQQRLSFIDLQAPGMMTDLRSLQQETSKIHQIHRHLRIDESPPEWAVSDTLGDYIFRRTGCSSQFPEIANCYHDYLETCLNNIWPQLLQGSPGCCAATQNVVVDTNLPILREYQLHHLHSSPGNVFLSKLFGNEWTSDFLHNFLFSEP